MMKKNERYMHMNYAEAVAKYSRIAEGKGLVNSLEGNLSMIDLSLIHI